MHSVAISESSLRVRTRPVGLLGVLRMIAFVRAENALAIRSISSGVSDAIGTNTGRASLRMASGP